MSGTVVVPSFLVAVDPGLDATGYALFDRELLGRGGSIEERCAPALVRWGRITTPVRDPIELRLATLGAGLGRQVERWEGGESLAPYTAVVIERPDAKAIYRRESQAPAGRRDVGAAMHGGLEKLHYAIATLLSAAQGARAAEVRLIRTPRIPKGRKSAIATGILRAWARAHGQNVPRTIPDERDAIYLGAWWLLEGPARARVEAARQRAGAAP